MDPLHIAIALVPLSTYLLVLGYLNFRTRPTVVNGFHDTVILAIAISGCVAAGPLELFFPETAAYEYGYLTWLLLFGFYLLVVTLIVLLMRPRIVIYNGSRDPVRTALTRAADALGMAAEWSGESFYIPQLGVHLHVDRHPLLCSIQLTSNGSAQSIEGWRRLQQALRRELADIRIARNYTSSIFTACALLLLAMVFWSLAREDYSLAAALREMLRIY